MQPSVVISGIQPTGNLHLGNYLGAVKNLINIQASNKFKSYVFIADLHSLTGDLTAAQRREQVLVTAAELIALGLDPKKTTFFVQSHVPEHTELAWVFNTITPVAELYRMTQFKDKSERQEKNINAGLLTYPALMAADILLYRAMQVPVGQDQVQHLELTRDTARWFNNRYGEYFKEVKPLLTEVPKVMSLLEPTKKMSKSLGGGHVIELADEPSVIMNKIKKAVTATEGGDKAPSAQNLLMLLKQFARDAEYKEFAAAEKDGTIRYGDLKTVLAEVITKHFADFRKRRAELLADPSTLEPILARGAAAARTVAAETLADVYKMVGLR